MEKNDDNVNHPAHYKAQNGMEAIDVIEAFAQSLTGTEAVCTGNALKYLLRWKQKNGVEDLKKARWYLDRLITHMETKDDHVDLWANGQRYIYTAGRIHTVDKEDGQ